MDILSNNSYDFKYTIQSLERNYKHDYFIIQGEHHDKNPLRLPRQQFAFLEECRKIKGCGSLEEDFYTRFIPNFSGFGAVTWRKKG